MNRELNSNELYLLSELLNAHRLEILETLQKANTQLENNQLAQVLVKAECKMLVQLLELNKSIAAKLGV